MLGYCWLIWHAYTQTIDRHFDSGFDSFSAYRELSHCKLCCCCCCCCTVRRLREMVHSTLEPMEPLFADGMGLPVGSGSAAFVFTEGEWFWPSWSWPSCSTNSHHFMGGESLSLSLYLGGTTGIVLLQWITPHQLGVIKQGKSMGLNLTNSMLLLSLILDLKK